MGIFADGSGVSESKPLPTKEMSRRSMTVVAYQDHTLQPGTSWWGDKFYDCDEFSSISVTLMASSALENSVYLIWSHDGVTAHGYEQILAKTSNVQRIASTGVKARYVRIQIRNENANNPNTFNVWAYFKV